MNGGVKLDTRQKIKIGKRRLNRSLAGNIGINIFLVILGLFMALPLVYAISNAFKPLDELFIFPPQFFVRHPTINNFIDLFSLISNSWVPFTRYLFNTVFITAVGTAGQVFLASIAAYALAKHRFPGSKLIFTSIVLSLMFSPVVTAIPNYLVMSSFKWIDTYFSVIVPAFQSSLGLYLMKQFMETVPDSLIEAARIDGENEFGVFWKIVMPAVKPAWLTLIIFSVQGLWNYTGGTYIYSEQLKPLTVALNQIMAGGIARAGTGAAVAVIMMLVPIILFLFIQSNIIETMSTSGMKD